MKIERCEMPSFAVIGKEGSTNDGEGFIGRLWQDAKVSIIPSASKLTALAWLQAEAS